MISAAWLTGALLLVGGLCVVLATVTAGQRAWNEFVQQRQARLLAPVRPLVLRVAAGADDGTALRELTDLNGRTWATVEPLVVTMLGKIRGEARDDLVALLQAHGAGDHALLGLTLASMPARARAAETLGVLGQPAYAEPLLGLLRDPSADVRQVAARALGCIGAAPAAPALLNALDGDHAVPAQTIAQALLRLGPEATPMLVEALGAGSDTVRAVVVEVLGLYQAVSAVSPIATALTADPSPAVRVRAATALGRLGHPVALASLVDALGTDHPLPLRATAAAALGELGAVDAVPELAALLADPDHDVARNAAAALTRLGAPGLAALTAATLDDPPPDGALVFVHGAPGNPAGVVSLAGAHAAAALAALPAERGRARG